MARFLPRPRRQAGRPGRRAARPRHRRLCDAVRAAQGRRGLRSARLEPSGRSRALHPRGRGRDARRRASAPRRQARRRGRRDPRPRLRARKDRRLRRRAARPKRKGRGAARASATCSTPRARPAIPRASRSRIRASAISSASPPRRYGFGPGDRVYQGMSIAFDFSIEEVWVPLVAGATLVPNTSATSLFGEELADFLECPAITCFACVPTLLASIDRELPKLRVFLIGGEACPPALVKRWSRPGRTLLNSYGPTETTVTATLGALDAREAGDHRQAAADLFDRHPRPRGGRRGRARRAGRDRHRRHRRRRGLSQPAGADAGRSSSPTSSPCRTTRRAASIAPATSAASPRTARSSISAASTRRSSCAATGSS